MAKAVTKLSSGTFEANPPKSILERAATAVSTQGIKPDHIATTRPGKINSSDWAIALGVAGEGNQTGLLCFWARWVGDDEAKRRLAVKLSEHARGKAPGKYIPRLAAIAAHEYCEGALSVREICRIGKISSGNTWPKCEGAYRTMVSKAYEAESMMARSMKKFMY